VKREPQRLSDAQLAAVRLIWEAGVPIAVAHGMARVTGRPITLIGLVTRHGIRTVGWVEAERAAALEADAIVLNVHIGC